ncbi:ABC transporter ATP-binding protein [Paenibacillus antibioticophila]|uniref:ABC transporter ATP-binding protein n=1 Tax=Paenibacillus antibioticophila TaxID=1274374 RepID=A0A919XXI8_9BACL|nr:ABC transporter ATP-binding protein [Paenibacillus antibioticophila]GIO38328.1 ABC transporter ATP-binding protein [Paenibacillus antibioticophila]
MPNMPAPLPQEPDNQDQPLIQISDVSFTYPGSEQPVLNGATLALEPGSFTAIIGGNGSGKSTLCKLFNGLIPHYYSGDFEGVVRIAGLSAQDSTVAELSRKVGYVYQDFENQLVRPTVLDEACFAPLNYGLPDYRARATRALELCGLTPLATRFIWELSGGQKHLLALAGALSLEPDILIVDEPVSQLDPQHARQVYEVLRRLHRIYGKTIIVIEHHAEFIADYCHNVCLIEQGRVVWQLPVHEALNRLDDLHRLGIQPPEITQTAAALAALQSAALHGGEHNQQDAVASLQGEQLNQQDERTYSVKMEEALLDATTYPITTEEALQYFARMLSAPIELFGQHKQQDPTPPRASLPAAESRTVISLKQAALTYKTIRKTDHPVLRGVSLDIAEGERIALVGNNGAGKSSLLRLIAGIAKPTAGTVSVLGQDTRTVSLEQLSRDVAFVFQNPEDMFIEDSVYKEVAHCLNKRSYEGAEATVERMLRAFRLEELRERDARLLSGGQQRRVSLAIGAATTPAVMLLDEPTANLDLATREELISTLQELEQHVRTVLIATHDMQLVSRWATRVIVLHEGSVAADGTAAEVFADTALIQRAGLALTQTMELSAGLNLRPHCSDPAELAARIHRILLAKESLPHGARPQLV